MGLRFTIRGEKKAFSVRQRAGPGGLLEDVKRRTRLTKVLANILEERVGLETFSVKCGIRRVVHFIVKTELFS